MATRNFDRAIKSISDGNPSENSDVDSTKESNANTGYLGNVPNVHRN